VRANLVKRDSGGKEHVPSATSARRVLTFPFQFPYAKINVAVPSGRSPADTVGSNPAGGMDVCLLVVSCAVS
jgi:hypothetical protein